MEDKQNVVIIGMTESVFDDLIHIVSAFEPDDVVDARGKQELLEMLGAIKEEMLVQQCAEPEGEPNVVDELILTYGRAMIEMLNDFADNLKKYYSGEQA